MQDLQGHALGFTLIVLGREAKPEMVVPRGRKCHRVRKKSLRFSPTGIIFGPGKGGLSEIGTTTPPPPDPDNTIGDPTKEKLWDNPPFDR